MTAPAAKPGGGGIGRATASSVAWNVIGQAADRLIGFAAFAIVVRLLRVEEAGLVMLAASAVDLFLALAFSGFGERVIQHRSPDRVLLGTVFWLQVGASVVLTGVFFAAAPAIAMVFGEERLTPLLQGLSALFVTYAAAIVPSALLARALRYKAITLASIAAGLAGGLAGVAVALTVSPLWALVVQRLVASLVYAGLALVAARFVPPLVFSRRQAGETLRFSGPLLGSALVTAVSAQAAPLMVGFFLPIEAVAYFRIASRLNEVINQFLISPINRVFLAVFVIIREDRARARTAFLNVLRVFAAAIYGAYALIGAEAGQVLALLFGPNWAVAGPVFSLLAIGAIGLPARAFVVAALTSAGRTPMVFQFSGTLALGTILATLVGAQHDVLRVAAALSALSIAMILPSLAALRVALGVPALDVLKALAVPLLAGLGAAAATWASGKAFAGLAPTPLPLFGAWAVGGVTFAALHLGLAPRRTLETIRAVLALVRR